MDDLDRPNLGDHVLEAISVEMHAQDEIYWSELRKLQTPRQIPRQFYPLISPQGPPPPKRPIQLSTTLHRYAQGLFYIEASKYPQLDSRLHHWLTKLAERIETRVIENVKEVESTGSFLKTLTYHGLTESDMRRTVAESLRAMVTKFAREQTPENPQTKQEIYPSTQQPQNRNIARERKAFVEPLLTEKGWSPLQWSVEAEVAYHTASD